MFSFLNPVVIRSYSLLRLRYCTMVKVLNVAEKNDAAKSIAELMSAGRYKRREGFSRFNKIYEFEYNLMNQNVNMLMTSVSGHLMNNDFSGQYKHWNGCSPVTLFDAPVDKFCPQNYVDIKCKVNTEQRSVLVVAGTKTKVFTFLAKIKDLTVKLKTKWTGRLFHNKGAAMEKALDPAFLVGLTEETESIASLHVTEREKGSKRTLEREVRGCQSLVIWTDGDREGENIGYEIIDVCKAVKPNLRVYRARFSEITREAIRRAVDNLGPPDKRVSDAVDVRMELDLRIGAAFTRFQTLRLKRVFPQVLADQLISYGSCQFPTLGFVVERYKQVQAFIPEPFWKLKVTLNTDEGICEFNWRRHRLFDHLACLVIFEHIIESPLAKVLSVMSKPKSKWRPVALDTVELEKLASRKLKINAKETMKVAEKLYTQGFISYPRTETNMFPKELDLANLVQQQTRSQQWGGFANGVLQNGPRPRNGNKTDKAHPPIHPTKYTDGLQGNEARIYEFIVRHFLACCSEDAKGQETTVEISVSEEIFTASGLMILARNYLEVYPYEKWNAKVIPTFTQGEEFEPSSIEMNQSETSPPSLLTEADLISLMDKHGIGTDATHAEHIETIKSRLYVGVRDDGKFVPGELGMGLVEGYDTMGYNMSKPHLRAELEADLKRICEGSKDKNVVLREQVTKYREVFVEACRQAKKIDEALSQYFGDAVDTGTEATEGTTQPSVPVMPCQKCRSAMVIKRKKDGRGLYLSCMGFPQCKNAVWFPDSVLEADISDSTCANCTRGDDVKKVKFKFKKGGVPPYIPLEYEGCILCDSSLKELFNVPSFTAAPRSEPSSQTRSNNNSGTRTTTHHTGGGGGSHGNQQQQQGGGARNVNQPKSNPTQQRSYSTTSSSVSRTPASVNINNTRTQSGAFRDSGYGTGGASSFQQSNASGRDWRTGNNSNSQRPLSGRNYDSDNSTARGSGSESDGRSTAGFLSPRTGLSRFGSNRDNNTSISNQSHSIGASADVNAVVCSCNDDARLFTVKKSGPNCGRQFYTCPKPPDAKCGFFLWADPSPEIPRGAGADSGYSSVNNNENTNNRSYGATNNTWNNNTGSSDVQCNCNTPAKQLTVQKAGPNKGRPFLACPKPQGQGCGFFQWADEDTAPSGHRGGSTSGNDSRSKKRPPPAASSDGGVRKKRKCGVCQMEGHNKKNCPQNR